MQAEEKSGEDRPDFIDMIGEQLAYWTFGPDPHMSGAPGSSYTPVRLVVWTLVAIAVSAGVSAVRLALSEKPPQVGVAMVLIPLLLPLIGALAHKPPRHVLALGCGLAAGVGTALALGIDGPYWTAFAAVCAGFLVCSVVFAAVTAGLLTRLVTGTRR
ncbi:hypothetical protein ITP53_02695 [Nonomuraea sp. K274]|uniref:Uncharacterized protein n=1 Tax=Nonomuraea cypriaca TaxID=1187855 RepID=A0A931EXY0_9ACTN|nr:hypothetical protein [Nonomuraea cypriaca]MBF8184671.1 hypothetical protein [Nonomuraea cypriaca]